MLHFDERFSGGGCIHRIMLVLHLNIYGVYSTRCGNGNAFRAFVDDIPAAALSICRHMAMGDILEDPLMKVSDAVVIGFVSLPKNFISYNIFPGSMINHFVKEELDRIDDVFIKTFEIIGGEFLPIFFNGDLYMFCKIIFRDER